MFRTPRCSASSFARDEPPGNPRPPLDKCYVDPRPSLTGSIGDFARPPVWPFTGALVVFVSPLQDLSHRESSEDPFMFLTPRCSASSFARDEPPGSPREPRLSEGLIPVQVSPAASVTLPDFARWPFTGALMVFVSPLQDLPDGEIRKIPYVSHAAVLRKQLRERRATGEPAETHGEVKC